MQINDELILDPNLVFYTPLGKRDGSKFVSDDVAGQTCVATGTIWTPQGRQFNAVTDIINCGDNTRLDTTTGLTVSCWFKLYTTGTFKFLVGRDDNVNRNYWLYLNPDLQFVLMVANTAVQVKLATNVQEQVNQWVHAVATFDGAAGTIYRNAQVFVSAATAGPIDNDDVSLTMGARAGLIDRNFTGLIGKVAIFNRALTQTEIHNLYLRDKAQYQ